MDRVTLVVAWVLAAAGCRQLFGIDDTAVASDAAGDDAAGADATSGDAPRSDAMVAPALCAQTHLRCADFDTIATGIGQFVPSVVSGGVWEEQNSAFARSPPRVLVAGVPAGATEATSGGIAPLSPTRRHVIARAWVQVSALSNQCEPFVFSLLVTIDAGVTIGLAPDGYHLATFGLSGSPNELVFGTVASGVHELELEVDLDDERATARANGATGSMLDPALGGPSMVVRYVGAGVSAQAAHGPCTATFDDVVVDEVPP